MVGLGSGSFLGEQDMEKEHTLGDRKMVSQHSPLQDLTWSDNNLINTRIKEALLNHGINILSELLSTMTIEWLNANSTTNPPKYLMKFWWPNFGPKSLRALLEATMPVVLRRKELPEDYKPIQQFLDAWPQVEILPIETYKPFNGVSNARWGVANLLAPKVLIPQLNKLGYYHEEQKS